MTDNKGSALLFVVLIMGIIFIMSSMIFGYSLRTFRLNQDINDMKKADELVEVAINETILQVLSQMDNASDLGVYTITNDKPFDNDSEYKYVSLVQEEGHYDLADYVTSGNVKSLRIKSNKESEEEVEDGAVEEAEDRAVEEEAEDGAVEEEVVDDTEEIEAIVTTAAIEIKAWYKEGLVTKRVIIEITITTDNYYQVDIYKCR